MTMEELEQRAAQGQAMPDGLDAPQRALYISLRGLYYQYRMNIIDKEQAKKEKAQIVQDYNGQVLDEKCRAKSRELWRTLPVDAMKCECPECKNLLMRIYGLK